MRRHPTGRTFGGKSIWRKAVLAYLEKTHDLPGPTYAPTEFLRGRSPHFISSAMGFAPLLSVASIVGRVSTQMLRRMYLSLPNRRGEAS